MTLRRLALAAALLAPLTVSAADLPVSYLVEEKPFKAAVAGTPLTFELYSDNTCTTLVQAVPVNVEDIAILSRLKQVTPKNDVKLPSTVELRTTLGGVVTSLAHIYLKVTGAGVAAVGEACQAQAASSAAGPGGSVGGGIIQDATGTYLGLLYNGNFVLGKFLPGRPPIALQIDTETGNFPSYASSYITLSHFVADCSDPGKLPAMPDGLLLYPYGSIGSVQYLNPVSGALMSVVAYSQRPKTAGSCGATFIPPDVCCGPSSGPPSLYGDPVTFDTATIPTPLQLMLP